MAIPRKPPIDGCAMTRWRSLSGLAFAVLMTLAMASAMTLGGLSTPAVAQSLEKLTITNAAGQAQSFDVEGDAQ